MVSSSKRTVMYLSITLCIIICLVQQGEGQPMPTALSCLKTITDLPGCLTALHLIVLYNNTRYITLDCCRAVNGLNDICSIVLFPTQPQAIYRVKAICSIVNTPSSGGSPPPSGGSPPSSGGTPPSSGGATPSPPSSGGSPPSSGGSPPSNGGAKPSPPSSGGSPPSSGGATPSPPSSGVSPPSSGGSPPSTGGRRPPSSGVPSPSASPRPSVTPFFQ